ncbi:MAG: hypothetical protein Q9211_002415 [Gyalolechia sp. 1 TL-2023]
MWKEDLSTSSSCSWSDWCAAKIEPMDIQPNNEPGEPLPSVGNDPRSLVDCTSQYSSNATSLDTGSTGARDRRVSFATSLTEPTTVSLRDEALEIIDLCSTLRSRSSQKACLGYFKDAHRRRYVLSLAGPPHDHLAEVQRITTLEGILGKRDGAVGQAVVLPRRKQAGYSRPDRHNLPGAARFSYVKSGPKMQSSKDRSRSGSRGCNASLLSLGILILELWFNERIEEQPFYKQYQDHEGNDNEYTSFNAAQKWQEQAMEEVGLDLDNLTRRCIYCAFGAASQGLDDDELRRAVYSEVVQPLEKLHARFEGKRYIRSSRVRLCTQGCGAALKTMRIAPSSWQAAARAKVADLHSRIPKEWVLTDPDLENAKNQRALAGPFMEQYLNDDEKDVVGHDSVRLVEKIKCREYTAVDVARAYCKTAAIAQQIVGQPQCLAMLSADCAKNNCLHEIMFDFAMETAKELDRYCLEHGVVKVHCMVFRSV